MKQYYLNAKQSTVDWKNFTVNIILQLRPTANNKILHSDDQRINVHVRTFQGKCPIDYY